MVEEVIGEVRWTVLAHAGEGSSTSVAMSPDKKLVASVGSAEANWKLWDAASGAAGMTGARHDGKGACICRVDGLDLQSFDEDCPAVAHTAVSHERGTPVSGKSRLCSCKSS